MSDLIKSFESKPSIIEAVYWGGRPEDREAVLEFAPGKAEFDDAGELSVVAGVDGAQKIVPVPVGHWVVSKPSDRSDIWPVEGGYFADKYREVKTA